MDKGIRAARQQTAEARILGAAETLAARLGFAVPTWPTGNQPEVVGMLKLEAVADLLETVAGALPAKRANKGKAAEPPSEEDSDGKS